MTLITLLLMAAGTYALRAWGPRLVQGRRHPAFHRWLEGVPAATAGALLIPGAFQTATPAWLVVMALAAAGAAAWRTRQLWAAVVAAAAVDYIGLVIHLR